jgi:methylmalonyl-CoA mutase
MDKDTDRLSNPEIAKDFPPNNWEDWLKAVEDTLKGVPFDKAMVTKTYEGIKLKPIYRKEDIQDLPHLNSLPGQAPFVRGNTAEGYTTEGWVIAQQQNKWNPAQVNQILKKELNSGLNAVNLKLDMFTKWAITPPQDRYITDGVCLRHLQDLETLLDGIDLKAVPIFIDSGEASITILGLFAAYCKKNQIPWHDLHGFIGYDYLSSFAQVGELLFSENELSVQMAQLCTWASDNAPELRTILLDGACWGNHGLDSMQELAYILASANECIKILLEQELTMEQIVPRFQINLCLGSNLFMEIAKVRAMRLLWAELMKAYGVKDELQKVWIHGVTSSFNKTQYDPYVNILRTATESFSGVIGGVDSLDVIPFDDKVKHSDEFSRRIARNQQIILKEETHLDKVIDPSGGCYYIETLTAQLAEKAWEKMQFIEEQGGMFYCISQRMIRIEVDMKAVERINNVNKRNDVFIGINMFANPLEQPLEQPESNCHCELQAFFDEVEDIEQSDRPGLVEALFNLDYHLKAMDIVDFLAEAILKQATLEEVHFKLYSEDNHKETLTPALEEQYATMNIEDLRASITKFQQQSELVLSVFLANIGPITQHKARADFAQGFLQVGGFYVANNDGYASVKEATEAALFSKAHAVCICSTDDTYPELVPALISEIKAQKPDMIFILAGYPENMVETYKSQGIDIFIHIRANIYETLRDLAKKMGVAS